MNPETLLMMTLNSALKLLCGESIVTLANAIVDGNPTDEQLAEFTNLAHGEFDAYDGCMVHTIAEMAEGDIPHYAINHAIRTYVRACDKREAEAAERDSSHNARYGKKAQKQ